MNNNWVTSSNIYALKEISQQSPKLPVAVYKFNVMGMAEEPVLERLFDKFNFPYKIYGLEKDFIDRSKTAFDNTTGNLGIILNGVKGTGKTVTAEQICNNMNLPVIIVPFHHGKLIGFLNEIPQDVVVMIDEYEKIYDGYENSLLTIMDGVLKTQNRIMFVLTTNSLRVDNNLLQRPGRIRYIKAYSDLTIDVIIEIVDDLLIATELRRECIEYISSLEIITIDLVKAIINEVNIFKESPQLFKPYFNAKERRANRVTVHMEIDGVDELLVSEGATNVIIGELDKLSHGYLSLNDYYAGRYVTHVGEDTLVVSTEDKNDILPFARTIKNAAFKKYFKNLPSVEKVVLTLKFSQRKENHIAFNNYIF